jgi:hypothetical protein
MAAVAKRCRVACRTIMSQAKLRRRTPCGKSRLKHAIGQFKLFVAGNFECPQRKNWIIANRKVLVALNKNPSFTVASAVSNADRIL